MATYYTIAWMRAFLYYSSHGHARIPKLQCLNQLTSLLIISCNSALSSWILSVPPSSPLIRRIASERLAYQTSAQTGDCNGFSFLSILSWQYHYDRGVCPVLRPNLYHFRTDTWALTKIRHWALRTETVHQHLP